MDDHEQAKVSHILDVQSSYEMNTICSWRGRTIMPLPWDCQSWKAPLQHHLINFNIIIIQIIDNALGFQAPLLALKDIIYVVCN